MGPNSGTATSKASPPKRKARSITGRDNYIIAESLYRYIATEQAKPDRECSFDFPVLVQILTPASARTMQASSLITTPA